MSTERFENEIDRGEGRPGQRGSATLTAVLILGLLAVFTAATLSRVTTEALVMGNDYSNSQAFYVQPAYRLPVYQGRLRPYYRCEYMHIPLSDALFRALPSYNGSTVGTRYDISSFAAFKLEYRHYVRRNLPGINGMFMQTSFTF